VSARRFLAVVAVMASTVAACSGSSHHVSPQVSANAPREGSSNAARTAILTGYRVISPGQGTSGPVRVLLSTAQTATIWQAVHTLVRSNPLSCAERLGLIYKLRLPSTSNPGHVVTVAGYQCAAGVSVRFAGKATWYFDQGCKLFGIVKTDSPLAATATVEGTIGCLRVPHRG